MIPLRDIIPSRTTPYVTVSIIILNAAAWFFELSLPGDVLPSFLQAYGAEAGYEAAGANNKPASVEAGRGL